MASRAIPIGVRVTYRRQYRRCGKAGCTCCGLGRPGHGPYWYAFWREGGRPRSRYVGKEPPPGAAVDVALQMQDPSASAPAAPVPAPALQVKTLGGFAVWRGETPIPAAAWSSRRALALFKCLLGAPGQRLPREQAIELLWPDVAPEKGATNLRTTAYLLRRILGGPGASGGYLRSEGEVVTLAPAGTAPPPDDWLDAAAFVRAADRALAGRDAAMCRAALALYGGEYLPEDPYEAWAAAPREALRRQYLDLLLHLAGLSAAQGELDEAEACLRRALATEPGHEGAAGTLMGLLAARGERGEALRVYRAAATALEDELGLAPDAEMRGLRARLLAQDITPRIGRSPSPRVPAARPTNLLVALTSFVGRTRELAEVGDLLAAARLVTLTGPGGCGKTRLALQAAGTLVDAHEDGVWLVELAALADPTLVPQALATALGVAEEPGRPLRATLRESLRPRQALLVLDNCEHLLDACAELTADLLRSCPSLRVLATSRQVLEVAGEQVYWVPSLAVPDPAHLPGHERLAAYEAVRLFLDRARERRPDLTLTATNAEAVAEICARLDGLPLAIELAAARAALLPVEGIAARLDDRFRLLTGGARTALPRQQTLRATLDWSYHLLREEERALLRGLSVFAGGCGAEAAAAVCWADPPAIDDALGRLGALADKSLLRAEDGTGGEPRFAMLETIRAYGQEQLAASGEGEQVRRRHAAYYLGLAETADRTTGAEEGPWLARLEAEHGNVRAALAWSMQAGATETAARLAGAMGWFWDRRGYVGEGRRWLADILSRDAGMEPCVRAKALRVAGALARVQGEYGPAAALFERSLHVYRASGDAEGVACVLDRLGELARVGRDHARATALLEEALALYRERMDAHGIAGVLFSLGCVARARGDFGQAETLYAEASTHYRALSDGGGRAWTLAAMGFMGLLQGDDARATPLLEEALALHRDLGDVGGSADTLKNLARAALARGDDARATALAEEALALYRNRGDGEGIPDALIVLGDIAGARGKHDRARALLSDALARFYQLRDTLSMAECLERLARVAYARGQLECAVHYCGAAAALRDAVGAPVPPAERAIVDHTAANARVALGAGAFAAVWERGRASPEQTIAAALRSGAGTTTGPIGLVPVRQGDARSQSAPDQSQAHGAERAAGA